MDEIPKSLWPPNFAPGVPAPGISPRVSPNHYKYSDGSPDDSESMWAEYKRVFKRRRSLIFLVTLTGALIGFLLTVAVLPVYRARTSLDIQNLNADFMNMKVVAPTGSEENASTEAYVQTQIKLLQSDTLRARTVAQMRSATGVASLTRDDLLSRVRRLLHVPGDSPLSSEALLHFTANRVSVKPLGMTRLVEVTCDSWNAQFSADFCNMLTRQFAEQDREVRWNEAQKTSEWLSRQLADVRAQVAESEKKLEAATGDSTLVLNTDEGSGNESVAEDKLRQLQAALMTAESERVAKQAQYEISTSGSPDSLPMVLDSGQLQDTAMKLEDLKRQVASMVPPLTEANPKVQHLRAQIKELQTSLDIDKGNVVDRITKEYEAARHREALLKAEYEKQERLVTREQGKEAQYSMLRREVLSGQQLYQTLLQRVKEAGFASAMQASTVRVVDAAKAPEAPIAPSRATSVSVGTLIGILAGIGLAFFKERTQTALRAPGDVTKYLKLRELGVIPSARRALNYRSTAKRANSFPAHPSARAAIPEAEPQHTIDMTAWQDHTSLVAEAYRTTTYSVLLAGREMQRTKAFVVSSPNVGEGKTTVTCNLGLALAQTKRKVLIIDGDLRKPRVHKLMGLPNEAGLRDLLRGDLDISGEPLAMCCQSTGIANLSVITSGSGLEEPTGLLHSPILPMLLNKVSETFDIVLVDSPPMLHMADARILAGISNGVILVFRSRVTDRQAAAAARDLFLEDQVEVVGTILNDFDPFKEGDARYYNSYYAYREASREKAAGRTA
jgi:succinoglycan biosynthesis transport protein ExoP